jgi:hypothetical protein
MLRYILFFLFSAATLSNILAQSLQFEGVKSIRQLTFDYSSTAFLSQHKVSDFDTNQIMISQFRISYESADTANSRNSEYYYQYNPATRNGNSGDIRYPNSRNKLDSIVHKKTKFRSFDHKDNFESMQQFDEKGKLFLETQYNYNPKGLRISSSTNDLKAQILHSDKIERNDAGKILRWTSYDTEYGKERLVRDIQYTYLADTLLLNQEGYIYNNWNKTSNKYDKNNKLSSSTIETGYRQDGGKILRDAKTVINYKDGNPVKRTYTENGKKLSFSTFKYAPNIVEESSATKNGKTQIVVVKIDKKLYDAQNRLVETTQIEDGKIKFSKQYTYQDSLLVRYTEIEYKVNGDQWKTDIDYNPSGNPTTRRLYKGTQLWQEDQYEYTYFERK